LNNHSTTIQQPFNNHSTTIQQPFNNKGIHKETRQHSTTIQQQGYPQRDTPTHRWTHLKSMPSLAFPRHTAKNIAPWPIFALSSN
jgi:hypothetical protein